MHLSGYLVVFFFSSVQNAIVTLLAHWTIHVILEDGVCVILTMLDLDVTSVLQVITAIPAACVSNRPSSFYCGVAVSLPYSREGNLFFFFFLKYIQYKTTYGNMIVSSFPKLATGTLKVQPVSRQKHTLVTLSRTPLLFLLSVLDGFM